jgi:hypothetical protein
MIQNFIPHFFDNATFSFFSGLHHKYFSFYSLCKFMEKLHKAQSHHQCDVSCFVALVQVLNQSGFTWH